MGMVSMTCGGKLISVAPGSIRRIALSNWTVAQTVRTKESPFTGNGSASPCRPDRSFVAVHLRVLVGCPSLLSATLTRLPSVC
jgi:hypothetical protein